VNLEQPSDYFVHPIYWANDVIFDRSFVNSISTSVTGREQRNILTTLVRRKISYSVITRNQEESYYLKGHLRLYLHLVWGVPLWIYDMTLTANASSTTLNVNSTAYRELLVGQGVILVTNYKTYEVGTIDSFDATSITLSSGLSSTWIAGTKVYPVLRSEIGNAQEITVPYKHLFGLSISFVESFRGAAYS